MKKILPYILTSLCVVALWKLRTWTDNYAFSPERKEVLMLDIALTSIFFYKTILWLSIANLTVFAVQCFKKMNYKTVGVLASVTLAIYFLGGRFVDKKCAFFYYSVFKNQSTVEDQITRPILEAGYNIGPILTENIADKEMKYRRYAIGGLEKINYKPATPILTKILLDKSEIEVFRADAFQTLAAFDTEETRTIISNFRNNATDSIDKKVVELGDYFIKNN